MDLGIGFDWQFLFIAPPDAPIAHAKSINRPDIAEWIGDHAEDYRVEDMDTWLREKIAYFRMR